MQRNMHTLRKVMARMVMLLFCSAAHAQYCVTNLGGSCGSGDYINSFSTTGGSINITANNTGCNSGNNGGFSYNFSQSHTAAAGATVNFTLQNNPAVVEAYKIWVDWNADFDFLDANEEVYSATLTGGQTVTSSFTVPPGTGMGVKRLRVRCVYNPGSSITACGLYAMGEIEDYDFVVASATSCSGTPTAGTASTSVTAACPNTPFSIVLSGSTLASGITIQWQSASGSSTSFTNISGANGTTLGVNNQTSATSYRAVVKCGADSAVSNVVNIPMSSLCYCSPLNGTTLVTGNAYDDMTNVNITGTTLNSTTTFTPSPSGYMQLTAPPASNTATLNTGTSYAINMSFYAPVQSVGVWIDYNQSGTFDATEFIPVTLNITATAAFTTFTPPATALPGMTGMRFAVSEVVTIAPSGACSTVVDGEVEDYMVTIAAGSPTPCAAPTGVAASNLTANSATLSWTAPSGATGYQYVLDQSSANPTGSGTGITTTTYSASGLAASTTYYFHVRTVCGSAASTWVTTSFTTSANPAPCAAPTGLAASGITSGSATLTWTAPSGASGYEYVLNQSATQPTGSGTTLAATTSYPASGLAASTAYYFHLRTRCGTATSLWVTTSFTTSPTSGGCGQPVTLTVTNTSATAVSLTWTTATGATGYEHANTTTATPPAAGTPVTTTSATYASLITGGVYYAHVRTKCGTTFSAWRTTQYTKTGATWVEDVNALDGFMLNASPNPAGDVLTVRVESKTDVRSAMLTLTDVAGRVLHQAPVTEKETTVRLTGLPAGLYLLRYTDAARSRVMRVEKL